MVHRCPNCSRVVAKLTKAGLVPVASRLVLVEKSAPKVKCVCGKSLIFLRGTS